MKKILLITIMVFAFMFSFISCKKNVSDNTREVKIYFSNSTRNGLSYEIRSVPKSIFSDKKELISIVMAELFKGPLSSENKPVIPLGTNLRGVSVSKSDDATVNIDIGGEYYREQSQDDAVILELLGRYSIIRTVTDLDGIDRVQLYVNGKQLRSDNGMGEFVGVIAGDDIMTQTPSKSNSSTEKLVTLYFSDSQDMLLDIEARRVKNDYNNFEKNIVEALIAGPEYQDHKSIIPKGTTVISIEKTEGVCFVNLSEEFNLGLKAGSAEEKLAVYSVVNTLTRLSDIEKVQILTEGKKRDDDPSLLYASPLERDPTYIKN